MFLDEQRSQISELRANAEDLMNPGEEFGTDFDLFRYLEGFNFDVTKATAVLRNHLRLRQVSPHVRSDFEPVSFLQDSYYFMHPGRHCVSKSGHILHYEWVGKVPVDKIRANPECNFTDFYSFRLWANDKRQHELRQNEADTGRQSGLYLVYDLQGMEYFGPHGIVNNINTALRYYGEFFASHYVEVIKKMAIVNAPTMLRHAWSVLCAFIPEKTQEKIRMLGSPEELLVDFDAENLPEMLGGTLAVNLHDRNCAILPPEQWEDTEIPSVPDLRTIFKDRDQFHVRHGRSLYATIVKTVNTPAKLNWSFFTNGALDFGIFWYPPETQVDRVNVTQDEWVIPHYAPVGTHDKHSTPEVGEVVVNKPGLYVVRLHYRFGWAWSSAHVQCKMWMAEEANLVEASYEIK